MIFFFEQLQKIVIHLSLQTKQLDSSMQKPGESKKAPWEPINFKITKMYLVFCVLNYLQ